MAKYYYSILAGLAIVFLLLMFGCSVPKEHKIENKPNISEKKINEIKPSSVLLDLHNKQRERYGVNPLILDKNLCEYAKKHANYMAKNNKLVHSSMSNLQKVNKEATWVGENIAWGQKTEKEVVESWMWSPGHRWNILGSKYSKIGFAVEKDDQGQNYWCVVFSN